MRTSGHSAEVGFSVIHQMQFSHICLTVPELTIAKSGKHIVLLHKAVNAVPEFCSSGQCCILAHAFQQRSKKRQNCKGKNQKTNTAYHVDPAQRKTQILQLSKHKMIQSNHHRDEQCAGCLGHQQQNDLQRHRCQPKR